MEKESSNEKRRFLEISKGSAAELTTQIYIGIEIGYIPKKLGFQWITELDNILRMITGLRNSCKSCNSNLNT